jgi:hypothetical protein
LQDDNTISVDLKDTYKKTYSEEELQLLRKPVKLRWGTRKIWDVLEI